jgi:hypothetical protein
VADGLAEDRWDADEAAGWHERALRLERLVDQARSAVGWSRESMRINLRRRSRALSAPGKDYDDAVVVLDYAAVHTAGVTRAVLEAAHEDRPVARPDPSVARRYADFLRRTAQALQLYCQSRFGSRDDHELREAVRTLRDTHEELRRHLTRSVPDDPGEVATYGTLLTQARRLVDQLVATEP